MSATPTPAGRAGEYAVTLTTRYERRVHYKGGQVVASPIEDDDVPVAIDRSTPGFVKSWYPSSVTLVEVVRVSVTEEVLAKAGRP